MQKKIIALAVAAAASTGAFAQTNVTIYGVADAGLVYMNGNAGTRGNNVGAGGSTTREAKGQDTFAIQSGLLSGSRLGFTGSEDLGNGLKAVFTLEQGFNIDNGTAGDAARTAFNRQSFVGLAGKFGSLTLGRQYAPGYAVSAAYDATGWSALSPLRAGQTFIGAALHGSDGARWDNSVKFTSANMGGLTVDAVYGMSEVANEMAAGEKYGLGLTYVAGPVAASYVYQRTVNAGADREISAVAAGDFQRRATTGQDEHFVGLSYDAKVVKVLASVQVLDQGNKGVAGQANSGEVYNLGLVAPMGKGNLHTSIAFANKDSSQRPAANNYVGQQTSANVAYTYGLSKRTTLYTGLTYAQSDVMARPVALGTAAGGVTTTFAAGLRHTF